MTALAARNARRHAALMLGLLLALALRIALWGQLPRTELISDEGEYLSAATWLAEGRGFDWYQGYLWTRAPIYPLFVAAHLRLFGNHLAPIYATQTLLSLLNVVLVYVLAGALSPNTRIRALAAVLAGVYLPFAIYPQALLSETLYISLLLAGFLALLRAGSSAPEPPLNMRKLWPSALAGILIGLATLTRSLTLGFLPVAALWLCMPHASWHAFQSQWRMSLVRAAVFGALAGMVILPWSVYTSRTNGGLVVVDTSGAYNLLLGARTAYDGQRSDAQVRDFVLGLLGQPQAAPVTSSCRPYPGTLPDQAARQAAMTREGLCLIAARPGPFVAKSLAELVDLFQINYTGAERFTDGFSTGRLPPWYVLALLFLDDTIYVLALPLAVLGWCVARATSDGSVALTQRALRMPFVTLAGLWWLYNLAVAPLLFAINRFRLPLLPLVFIFAAWMLLAGWRMLRRSNARVWHALGVSLAALLFLVAATPYAYFEPRSADQPSRWASYLGPYPSSIDITMKALAARPRYLADQRFEALVLAGQFDQAELLIQQGQVGDQVARIGPALIAGRRGDFRQALALLPTQDAITRDKDVPAAVVRGDALRSLGQERAALDLLGARFVDDANPVAWAWEWLAPAPTRAINVGGSLDLGYIAGCYLGEGDPEAGGNFRWCSDGAQLRFPGAGRMAPQTLTLRIDGRAWHSYRSNVAPAQVLLGQQQIGTFAANTSSVEQFSFALPPTPDGSELVITIRTPTFVPDAARYNSQQGRGVVGQVHRLGVRIDEMRVEP